MIGDMICSSCGHALARSQGIDYLGDHVRHMHRDDCIRALRAEVERLTKERDLAEAHAESLQNKLAQASAEVVRLEGTLINVAEYWNRDQNEKAMADALWHIIEVSEAAIRALKGEKE